MPTDLKNVYDHPASLLEFVSEYSAGERLRNYEQANDVTFTALDNDALEAVREAYEALRTAGNVFDGAQAGQDLAESINQLLGLGD